MRIILFLSLLFSVPFTFSQTKFPKEALDNLTKQALKNNIQPKSTNSELQTTNYISGIHQLLYKFKDSKVVKFTNSNIIKTSKSDTLFVFSDMNITGNWTHNRAIVIGPNATLTFNKANATIIGDIVLFGDSAMLIVDSSYMYFPQEYFYQRNLIAVKKSFVNITNSTLDYSDLSHNLVASDNASVTMQNVINKGFTTNGIWGSSSISIDGTNQAGEYIVTDKCKLDFKNATTILLWHHFADSAVINFAFPDGKLVSSYIFNNKISGVNGVGYDIKVTNSKDVMWGMMPANGSDITISNSKIRSIGLWFLGSDSVNVSGLVDNSTYSDFKASIPDRNLHLFNSSVQTWSLYPMENSKISISGCILGEVGSEGKSKVTGNNFYVDGSGGYFWSGDNSIIVAGWSTATTSVRSQSNSIFIFGYSALTNGNASAIGNSILMVIQSSLPQDPVPLEGGDVWFANISQPDKAYIGDKVIFSGSAWIDKETQSLLMDFNYYRLFYQKAGDSTWTQIGGDYTNEVRNATLGTWDTQSLLPGQYNIKLALTDNTPDKNTVEGIKSFNLLPEILNTNDLQLEPVPLAGTFDLRLIPDPSNHFSVLSYQLSENENVSIKLYDYLRREVRTIANGKQSKGNHKLSFFTSNLQHGMYFLNFSTPTHSETMKFTVSY